ncbi:HalOD1 output domain-containing protein [Halobellus sp. GM3]|uniref:HalOD1 output domain-containing protein n=1 Tax=Halobellus sp. GM3 TaxID=3458410 RepID=UPI00403D73D7
MDSAAPGDHPQFGDLLVEIIETLEAAGLDSSQYQLHDSIDLDALERILASSNGEVSVRFSVEGIRLAVTSAGVDVVNDDRTDVNGR